MEKLNSIQVMDCIEGLKKLPDNFLDCCVTDPPWGIRFMQKNWDYDIPGVDLWKEVLRVLKPGAHILVACGTRTQHRMAVHIEDAGFEIRDVITWHYGSGFPKSTDVSKQLDKMAGAERKVIHEGSPVKRMIPGADQDKTGSWIKDNGRFFTPTLTMPVTEAAKQWDGWGTALKPTTEFWTLGRKPISEKTVAANVLKYGTGGLNINASRVPFQNDADQRETTTKNKHSSFQKTSKNNKVYGKDNRDRQDYNPPGRFPGNLILDECSAEQLDSQGGNSKADEGAGASAVAGWGNWERYYSNPTYVSTTSTAGLNDLGGPSRFFYTAKADSKERGSYNYHPTVKPLSLMNYLVQLICPPGGILLEPFAGSGSTCIAARQLGNNFIAYEKDPEYAAIAERRLKERLGMFSGK